MIITLLTDFGTVDSYVAELKGALLRRAPAAVLVDVAHDLAAGDVGAAAYVLGRTWRAFPDGTVHLAVVDPGVGTPRRALAGAAGGHRFVAPDNGLLTDFISPEAKIFHLNRPGFFLNHISQTFHGRDIFAPCAAHLAKGKRPEQLGEAIPDAVRLPRPQPEIQPGRILGQVIHIDRFGNLITNISKEQLPEKPLIRIMGKAISGISNSYDAPAGTLLAIIGSAGHLEISLARDSAAHRLKAGVGQAVELSNADG